MKMRSKYTLLTAAISLLSTSCKVRHQVSDTDIVTNEESTSKDSNLTSINQFAGQLKLSLVSDQAGLGMFDLPSEGVVQAEKDLARIEPAVKAEPNAALPPPPPPPGVKKPLGAKPGARAAKGAPAPAPVMQDMTRVKNLTGLDIQEVEQVRKLESVSFTTGPVIYRIPKQELPQAASQNLRSYRGAFKDTLVGHSFVTLEKGTSVLHTIVEDASDGSVSVIAMKVPPEDASYATPSLPGFAYRPLDISGSVNKAGTPDVPFARGAGGQVFMYPNNSLVYKDIFDAGEGVADEVRYQALAAQAGASPRIYSAFSFKGSNGGKTAGFVMERVYGTDLKDYLLSHAKETSEVDVYGIKTSKEVAFDANSEQAIVDSFARLSATGIRHEDLNMGNVMLKNDGSAVIIDFGQASRDVSSEMRKKAAHVGNLKSLYSSMIVDELSQGIRVKAPILEAEIKKLDPNFDPEKVRQSAAKQLQG